MSDESTSGDSAVGMTIKQMVTELYGDMKVVRPQVESLTQAQLVARVENLERKSLVEESRQDARMDLVNIGRGILLLMLAAAAAMPGIVALLQNSH